MKRGEIIFLVLSLVIIITGTVIFFEASAFQKKAGVTDGTVSSSSSTYYSFRYITEDGVERTHKSIQGEINEHVQDHRESGTGRNYRY